MSPQSNFVKLTVPWVTNNKIYELEFHHIYQNILQVIYKVEESSIYKS